MQRFITELQRRNVHRAALFYAGAAWLLVQVATQVLPFFHIDESVVRWIVIAVVVGFPFAMLFSWFYEWTPQGIKLESEIDRSESVTKQTGKAMDRWIIAVMAVAIALLLLNQFVLHRFTASTPAMEAASSDAIDKSIAVLPFENLSDDKANAYFVTGIQDEILTRLSKIGALKVISRTSTAHYASSPANLPEIARQLGAAHILEGSVQRVGDTVKITVQLIHAASDKHLWAESYNRKLDDVFAVEGEVAQAIAETLQARLAGAEVAQIAAKPTSDPAAYDAYLRGLDADNRAFGPEQLRAASRFYAQAVQLDPGFALAWARGSNADGLIYFQAFDHSAERLEAARHGAEMAMRLAPESGEAWLAKGLFLYHIVDYDGAAAAYEEASRRLPNNPEVFGAQAFLERRRGHYERAIELLERSVERDPQNINVLATIAETLIAIGRPAEARQWTDRGLTFRPGDIALILWKAQTYIAEGDLDAAGKLIEPLPPQLGDASALGFQINYLGYRRNYAAAVKTLQAAMAAPGFVLDGWTSGYYANLGWAQRWAGNEQAARATFVQGRQKLEALRASWSDNGNLAAKLAWIDAGLGDADTALREAERSLELAGKDQYSLAGLKPNRAAVQALSGHKDQALASLETLAKERLRVDLGDLRYSPAWDSLRSDPRFQKLIADGEAAANP